MTTMEAMKQADYVLASVLAVSPDSITTARTGLQDAIKQEEAQAVEPCAGKNCGTTNPKLHSAECFAEHESAIGAEPPFGYFSFVLDDGDGYWREAEDGEGTPLFTHPTPAPSGEHGAMKPEKEQDYRRAIKKLQSQGFTVDNLLRYLNKIKEEVENKTQT